ncbi:triosephosphate isomerase [Variibacter gotjawalensis]|uniref:Triosephosphate isomerase n=1 Tax=Variibacter gotjawalensis TaxID=1333996 RepID=A0A0S3PWI1_9BRAD|nr:triose-phosphate isomerase [Variibacter gotjawalensis]NIK46125.1 triosephosphate isomerase [Variibacter gotjawalensis]RZS48043.1 triosephosphate isomerase [Variibacter gotjawalensis]BAT60299.1 triosephosphate isomerase [Variibacter gotjawalensis]
MDRTRRPVVAGNWKMNGLAASVSELKGIMAGAKAVSGKAELLVCPPATLVASFAKTAKGSTVHIGGQTCYSEASGAFTGEISAEMLADAGATHVIVGHSERRTIFKEKDADVQKKALAARRAGLISIVCVGETKEQREADRATIIVGQQLTGSLPEGAKAANLIVAYEPVWAIGTGLTPTPADIAEMHNFIRERLAARFKAEGEEVRILYGGSVKASNAAELMAVRNVDGALVGGASLKADDFLGIANVYA